MSNTFDIKISIIVPIYNVENYLAQCLDSIYPQITPQMEVILVNDGSTDKSLDICKEFQNKYPNTIIINKENGGLSDARNAGSAIATGKYIYYLDSDDWLTSDALEQLYNFAEEHQCEVVQGNFFYAYIDHLLLDNRYIKEEQSAFILSRKKAMKELIKNEYIKNFAWGKLYLASIAKKYPFKKGAYFEDAFWQHHIINEVNRYGVLPTPLYYYRQRENSISGNFSIRNLDLLKGYEERLKFIQKEFPELSTIMMEKLWQILTSFYRISQQNQDEIVRREFQCYWKRMHSLYSPSLKIRIQNSWCYLFYQRIFNRLFGQTLKRIEI